MKSNELFLRIAKVCSGNVGIAIVSFVISLLLLRKYGQEVFAVFSMFLVFSSLHLSIVNSSFLVPASRIETLDEKKSFIKDCSVYFYSVSILLCISFSFFLYLSDVPNDVLWSFPILYLCYVLRGYIRAYSFVVQVYNKSLVSDLSFSILAILIVVPLLFLSDISVSNFCLVFSLLCLSSLLPFGLDYLKNFTVKFLRPSDFIHSHSDKIAESKHAVIGVVYSEIVSNSHAYAIPLMFGIKSYAAIAAFFMLFRPFAIAASSFIQSERVPLIECIRNDRSIHSHLLKLINFSLLFFIGNFIAAIFILYLQKDIAMNSEILMVFAFCSLIVFARNVKSILSLGLQVKGSFQLVTFISSKYVILVLPLLFVAWLSGYTYSMIIFTMIIEISMLFDFYSKYRRSC